MRSTQHSAIGSSISRRATARAGTGCLVAFFSVFALFGLAFVGFIFVPAMWQAVDARSWVEVPCTITESYVETHSGDGTTYSVELRYDYEYAGVQYRGDRYQFIDMSSSGRAGKQAVVDDHPVGATRSCFVDPDDPSRAVVHRGLTGETFFALIPLVLVAIGIAGIVFVLRKARGLATASGIASGAAHAAVRRLSAASDGPDAPDIASDGVLELEPSLGRLRKFGLILLFTLFWNGITSVFVTIAVRSHLQGRPEWFLTVFIIPFVLIGLFMLVATVHELLSLFNPRVRLTVEGGTLRLGDTVALTWAIDGSAQRLRSLHIELVGRESATYRRGTDTHTDTHDFAEIPVVEIDGVAGALPRSGTELLSVPANTMHSFDAGSNRISWVLRVRGTVPRWPDVSDEHAITIAPRGSEEA